MIVAGREVEVVRHPGSAPAIVFLHEGLGSALMWRDFPARLAAATGRETIAYSRFGYGASDKAALPRPLDYMERDAREDVPRVLDALGLEKVVLFGHSDGASIALIHAADDAGGRVGALVLEAPHVFVEDVAITSIRAAKMAYDTRDLRARLARHHRHVDVAFRGWNDAWLDPRFAAWNIELCLEAIRVPVLVIQGEDDPYGTRAQPDAIARRVTAKVTTVMLPGVGHAPHREAPEATLRAVTAFLACYGPAHDERE